MPIDRTESPRPDLVAVAFTACKDCALYGDPSCNESQCFFDERADRTNVMFAPAAKLAAEAASEWASGLDPHGSEAHSCAKSMAERGGGFASAIADAFFRADAGNRRKLLGAFGELFFSYRT